MKNIIAIIALLSGLFAGGPAKAGPMEDCTAARRSQEQAFNDRDWDKLMAMYTKDVHYFSSTTNEVMIGADSVRAFFSAVSGDAKLRIGEHSAVQVAPNVVLCSGYQVLASANKDSILRVTLVLVNNNGSWLTAQAHISRLPR
jgi:ketosteroid isomerase-like protein